VYNLLLSPLTVKNMVIRNRIVMPPMAIYKADNEGSVTGRIKEHYLQRAANGVGLIIVESTYVTKRGKSKENQLGIYSDKQVPELKKFTEEIKKTGCKIAVQLNHSGSLGRKEILSVSPEAPSALPHPVSPYDIPEELSEKRLDELANEFGDAAFRACRAGFDAVEIHGANGYLLNQFYSPLTNKRRDTYGGSREKRLRFLLEVIQKVRSRMPDTMPLLFRLSSGDRLREGLTDEDACYAVPRIVAAGVDIIDVSGGLRGSRPEEMDNVEGYFVPLSREIKKSVKVPIIVSGGIKNPEFAERVLLNGEADLIGIGRALLKDPEWVNKI